MWRNPLSQFSLCSVTLPNILEQRNKKFTKSQVFVILPVPLSCWFVPQHCTLLELSSHLVIFSFLPSFEILWVQLWWSERIGFVNGLASGYFLFLNHVAHHCLRGRLQVVATPVIVCVDESFGWSRSQTRHLWKKSFHLRNTWCDSILPKTCGRHWVQKIINSNTGCTHSSYYSWVLLWLILSK